MNQKQREKIKFAICRAPLGILTIQAFALPGALAQNATNQAPAVTRHPIQLEDTVVTGRLTPTADTVGPAPLQTISSGDIEQAGTLDVLSTLLRLNPAFSGAGNSIGQVNNNASVFNGQPFGTGESFAALRNLPTLVLVDGRRLASSPLSGGQGVDLNLMPLSMVDRIEVLQDGASAIYGSDAIGGVINLITKKDYSGGEIDARIGGATDPSSSPVLQYQTSILAGFSTDQTRIVFGADLYHMDPVLLKDRLDISSANLLRNNVLPVGANSSSSFSGRIDDVDGSYVLAGSPFAAGAPGYRPGLTTPPIVSGGPFTSVAAYNAAAQLQLGYAPYLLLSTTPLATQNPAIGNNGFRLLNTSQFGTYSYLRQDRDNISLNADHDFFNRHLTLFGNFLFARDQSEAQLAPSLSPFLEQAGVVIPGNNPYNPFGTSLGGPVNPPNIRERFVQSGNRTFVTTSDALRIVGGVKGLLPSDEYSYELAGTLGWEDQQYLTKNAIDGGALNEALTPNGQVNGQGQPLSSLTDANGNPVPVFNFFSLGGNSPATLNAISTTLSESGTTYLGSLDGKIVGAPSFLELPAGPGSFAVGGQFIYESLSTSVDPITLAGLAPGITQSFPSSGSRNRYAGFAEVNLPIFSPEYHLPGFHSLELTVAGRYEILDPGGSAAVPKVGLLWQPVDNQITLRGGYSEGFLAPSIYSLYGPNSVNVPNILLPDGTQQEQITTSANPNLKPSHSQQFDAGFVFSPRALRGLTVSADYYHVSENNVAVGDYTAALNSLNALGSASPYASGYSFSDGSSLTTTAPNQVVHSTFGNLSLPLTDSEAVRTEGLDLNIHYTRPVGKNFGQLTLNGNANVVLDYQVQSAPGTPYFHYAGQGTYGFGAAQGIIPDYTVNCSLAWDFKNFQYVVSAHYIPGVTIPGNLFAAITGPGATQGSTLNGLAQSLGSFYTLDMQVSYEWGRGRKVRSWHDGLRLTLGCNNLTDSLAPLIAGGPDDYTDKNVYDLLGRFVYFEVKKRF